MDPAIILMKRSKITYIVLLHNTVIPFHVPFHISFRSASHILHITGWRERRGEGKRIGRE